MTCTSPVYLKGNYGSQLGSRGFLVPCGKCMSCRIQKTREWMVKMYHELETAGKGIFLTLTYGEKEDHPYMPLFVLKADVQKFIKRLRKHYEPRKLRYYAAGEYGENGRAHYHLIIYGLGLDEMECYKVNKKYKASKIIESIWKYGYNTIGDVNPNTARYCAKYIQKKDNRKWPKNYLPFQLYSKNLGIEWMKKNNNQIKDFGITINGINVGMPLAYKRKIDNEIVLYVEKNYENQKKWDNENIKEINKYNSKNNKNINEIDFEVLKERAREQAKKNLDAMLALKESAL